jgi:hypothetical protein
MALARGVRKVCITGDFKELEKKERVSGIIVVARGSGS